MSSSDDDSHTESELRHRTGKGKELVEEEISQDKVKKDVKEKKEKIVDADEEKPKTRRRVRQPEEEDEPIFVSKKVEYTVAIIRVIAIIVVFTILHGWVTRYILDPYMGRSPGGGLQFSCPEGLDCEKILSHIENVRLKE